MQSRETATAPAQAPDTAASTKDCTAAQSAAPQPLTEQLTELAALGWSVSELYVAQLKLAANTAKAEWQLSGRSLVIAAALLVCFGAGIILLWATTLVLLGVMLWQLSQSVIVTAGALLLLQGGVLLWCWRSLNYVLSQVGFRQSWRALRQLFNSGAGRRAKQQPDNTEAPNADRQTA